MSSNAQANDEPNKLGLSTEGLHLRMDWSVDAYVARFEEKWMKCGSADFLEFLPDLGDTNYMVVAMELMRVDAELAARAGQPRNIAHYLDLMPDVLEFQSHREQLEFELSRLSASTCDGESAFGISRSSKSQTRGQQAKYPNIGEVICGFELLAPLGSGAFSRVYLAAENSLARRLVILKFSTKFPGEASTLARLQHKNIVPI